MTAPGSHPAPQPGALTRWRWALVALAGIAAATFVMMRTLALMREAAHSSSEAVKALVTTFSRETVTVAFREDLPRLDPSGAGKLKVARLEATETLTRRDEFRVLWGALSLGATATEIRVPVVYDFEVPLDPDQWQLSVDGSTCVVRAPSPVPDTPPGMRTEELQVHVQQDWLRFDGEEKLHEHLRMLTPELTARAAQRVRSPVVREEARRGVATFVQGWLLGRRAREAGIHDVRVVFADEGASEAAEGAVR